MGDFLDLIKLFGPWAVVILVLALAILALARSRATDAETKRIEVASRAEERKAQTDALKAFTDAVEKMESRDTERMHELKTSEDRRDKIWDVTQNLFIQYQKNSQEILELQKTIALNVHISGQDMTTALGAIGARIIQRVDDNATLRSQEHTAILQSIDGVPVRVIDGITPDIRQLASQIAQVIDWVDRSQPVLTSVSQSSHDMHRLLIEVQSQILSLPRTAPITEQVITGTVHLDVSADPLTIPDRIDAAHAEGDPARTIKFPTPIESTEPPAA